MKQVVLAGIVTGALAAGLPGLASAQATGSGAAEPATGSGAGKAMGSATKQATTGDTGKPASAKTGAKSPLAQANGATSLGSVHISHAVKANGERLAPGTYTVRLTADEAKPEVKGQTPSLERWVEFLQGSTVKGREVVTIVPENEIAQVAKGKRVPNGTSRVEMLKDNEYVRVWINRGGNNYLIHLPPA